MAAMPIGYPVPNFISANAATCFFVGADRLEVRRKTVQLLR
jgi:hypothetical protein